jgi:hypothetical protein
MNTKTTINTFPEFSCSCGKKTSFDNFGVTGPEEIFTVFRKCLDCRLVYALNQDGQSMDLTTGKIRENKVAPRFFQCYIRSNRDREIIFDLVIKNRWPIEAPNFEKEDVLCGTYPCVCFNGRFYVQMGKPDIDASIKILTFEQLKDIVSEDYKNVKFDGQ